MKLFRLGLVVALLALSTGSFAAYQPPLYPQDTGALTSITAHIPDTAKLGDSASVSFNITVDKPLTEARKLWLYLKKDGQVVNVQVIDPHPSATTWTPGQNIVLGPFTITIPRDINAGSYTFEAGLYKEKTTAKGTIQINGQSPKSKPIIITTGIFRDKYSTPHYWHINKGHAVVWDGKPFMPAGGMFIYDRDWNVVKAQLDVLNKYGVKNIYLHLGVNQPYVWKTYTEDDFRFYQQTIDYLDDHGFTYGVEFQALETQGFGYDYGGPATDHIKTSCLVRKEAKEPKAAAFMVIDNATGKVVQTGTARIDGKNVEADVKVPTEGDYKVVFAVDCAKDGFKMYYWDDQYTKYVAKVHEDYSQIKLGPGFRFVVDPLWNEMNSSHDLIPSAPAFAQQFAQWLKQRYGTVEDLNKQWHTLNDEFASFSDAANSVPVERSDDKSTKRSVQFVYSRSADHFYGLDCNTTQFNYDMREFIGRSMLSYCCDIADEFKKMDDVPVIYKCFSDVDWWHINDTGLPSGLDGLGMESYGVGEPMLTFMAGHVFGECEQSTKTTWLVATETAEGNHQDVSLPRNKPIGYTDRLQTMYANFNALISGGAKAIYTYNMMCGRGTQEAWSDACSRDPRQLEWIATYDRILANAPALADFKPDVYYRYPALYHPCSTELWSDPCIDFFGIGGWFYREPIERSVNDLWILPSFSLRPDAPMFIVNLENTPSTTRLGKELTDAISIGKRITMIGFRKDIGSIPAIDKYYTNKFSTNERGYKFQVLKPTSTSRIVNKTPSGQVWNLIDGNVQINSEEVYAEHGYSPQNLVVGREAPIGPYSGVFRKLLGVTLLDLGPDFSGLSYSDNGVPVTVVTALTKTANIEVPYHEGMLCTYPSGAPAGEVKDGKLEIALQPADKTIVKAKYDWAPEGIMVDSLATTETAIIKGLSAKDALSSLAKPKPASAPCIWIEAESPKSHNFNFASLGALPTLSGNAFLGLETQVKPPKDTGWYATYQFNATKAGTYQLWLRENYLSYSSPCSYSIDGGAPVYVPNTLVPVDAQPIAQYNAVEDTRQIFAWYHYGAVKLPAGTHRMTVRVDSARPKGTVVGMADDRHYAKLIDCMALVQGGFTPNGKYRPDHLSDKVDPPMVNLLTNPSVEYHANHDEDKCDGWTASGKDGFEWTKPGWRSVSIPGIVDINCTARDAYCMVRGLNVKGGDQDRTWTSEKIALGNVKSFLAGGWIRLMETSTGAFFRIQWLDRTFNPIGEQSLPPTKKTTDWQEVRTITTRPDGAAYAVFQCVLPAKSGTAATFDDMVFARSEVTSP